jgi:hypothetical protein
MWKKIKDENPKELGNYRIWVKNKRGEEHTDWGMFLGRNWLWENFSSESPYPTFQESGLELIAWFDIPDYDLE